MEYKRFGNTIALRLDPGDEIIAQVLAVAKKENVTFASVTGIGGADEIEIGVFNMDAKAYDKTTLTGTHEITSLVGNVNTMQGEAYTHLHITCAGKGGAVVGGHLLRCVISLTAEIFLTVIDASVDRTRREDLQINVWKL
ncbi:MAG: DUF296 domain-containing protein [Clostridia bacterium]|nr:DUF296 domain-containing protein [Clostridia bacterium]